MQGYVSSPAHRSNQSLSLQAPGGILLPSQNVKQNRRMTSPAMASQSSLSLPDGGRQPSSRPPSPLRNSFTMNTSTGIDLDGHSEDGSESEDLPNHNKWQRSSSPSSSVSGLAASFVQRVGNFVGTMGPKSPNLPSEAELEAEAERERERSRREAEVILTREAQQRQQVQQRMLAMMDNAKGLPPPPSSRSYTLPTTPSPSNSQQENNNSSWWQSAKNRLTPTKEKDASLTPAQQVILDAKAKDAKGPISKTPSMSNLNIPVQPPARKPVPASPSSPTPSRPSLSTPNLTPSPMRTIDSLSTSPSRESPPAYAQFTSQGTLDVPGTLLAIARRFEKLEKWTIGHVRALEDRMNDVERWLVDKESQKDEPKPASPKAKEVTPPAVQQELGEIREEISELQGRVGELGREMAKMAIAPSNLSSGPKSQTAAVNIAPRQASTTLVHETLEASVAEVFSTPRHSRLSSSARESTSPPLGSSKTASGTRLPYPTGDYNAPEDSFSPTNSPPASINSAVRHSSNPISGLPSYSSSDSPILSVYNLASTLNSRPLSPPVSAPLVSSSKSSSSSTNSYTPATPSPAPVPRKESGNGTLPPPRASAQRTSSVSPTPRKRYTVALGGPIVAPPELQSNASEVIQPLKRAGTKGRPAKQRQQQYQPSSDEDDDEGEAGGGETIGKSASARFTRNLTKQQSNTSLNSVTSMSSVDREVLAGGTPAARYPSAAAVSASTAAASEGEHGAQATPSPASSRRLRAQSVYGFSSIPQPTSNDTFSTPTTTPTTSNKSSNASGDGGSVKTTAPLRLKTRSKSSERLVGSTGGTATSGSTPPITPSSARFVDPLLLRRKQEVAAGTPGGAAMSKSSGGKLAVGQLVAFFDKDKDKKRRS